MMLNRSVLILLSSLAATSAYAEIELEGREGLTLACRKSPENTDVFCTCLVDSALKELPQRPRQQLYLEWVMPDHFNFRGPMSANDLPEVLDQMWGAWQRKAVPMCNVKSN